MKKIAVTLYVNEYTINKVRDFVYYSPGMTISCFAETALITELAKHEPIRERNAPLRPGRKIHMKILLFLALPIFCMDPNPAAVKLLSQEECKRIREKRAENLREKDNKDKFLKPPPPESAREDYKRTYQSKIDELREMERAAKVSTPIIKKKTIGEPTAADADRAVKILAQLAQHEVEEKK